MKEEKLVESIFDGVVDTYDTFLNSVTIGLINQWQNELINNIPSGEWILDIGTGTGEIIKKINNIYPESKVIGLDLSMNMLKKAKEKTKESPNNVFIRASAVDLPFKDQTIDVVLSSLTFRHLDTEKAVKEINRVLKKGGYVGILDIVKPSSKMFAKIIEIFADKIFRPIGTSIFLKEEYDYFVKSVKNALTVEDLRALFSKHSFVLEYQTKKFFGLVTISIFRKKFH
ncbi:MAG: class I SAM-dependent methyltransferase [Aquificae bacterium]|nr:class I SAM-dependent methyltransferase [Aquificota bacterium]